MAQSLLELNFKPPETRPGDYRVEVIDNIQAFVSLEAAWRDLMDNAAGGNLFLSHEWLSALLAHFPPEQLLVIIIRDGEGRLVAAAPWMIRKRRNGFAQRMLRSLEFIGTDLSIYDVVYIPIRQGEDPDKIYPLLLQTAMEYAWDVLDLQYGESLEQWETLKAYLAPRTVHQEIFIGASMPYLPLPETVEKFEATRKTKSLREVRRLHRKIERELGEYPVLIRPDAESPETMRMLDRFFDIHTAYWTERGHPSKFTQYPQLASFYKDVMRRTWRNRDTGGPYFLFTIMKSGDLELGYQLGAWQNHSYLGYITNYNSKFSQYSPGVVKMENLMLFSIEQKAKIFSFGRGDEPYKTSWAQDKQPVWNLRVCRNGKARAMCQLDETLKRIYRAVK